MNRNASGLSVGRGFAWLAAAYAVCMLCQWSMIVLLARRGSPESVGRFGLALATTAPIVLFTGLGLRRVLATDAGSGYALADYIGLRRVTNGAAVALTALVVGVAGFSTETALVVVAMAAAKAVEASSDILHGAFQREGRIDYVARSLLLRGPLTLAGLAAGFLITGDLLWGVLGMGAGGLATLALYDWPRARRIPSDGGRPAGPTVRRCASLAGLALPLGVVALLISLKWNLPNLVVGSLLGEASLGLYVPLAYFLAASNRFISALGEAGTVRLAASFSNGDSAAFARLLAAMLLGAMAFGVGGWAVTVAAGGPLLTVLYGPEYAVEAGALVLIMAAAVVVNLQTVLDYAMTAARRFAIQPWLYGVSSGLLFLLCLLFVPAFGLRGAAIAIGLGSLVECVATGAIVAAAVTRKREGTATVLEGS